MDKCVYDEGKQWLRVNFKAGICPKEASACITESISKNSSKRLLKPATILLARSISALVSSLLKKYVNEKGNVELLQKRNVPEW